MKKRHTLIIALLLHCTFLHAKNIDVEKWGVFEIVLDGPMAGNPFTDVEISATFLNGDNVYAIDGFYDGDGIYKIRFMPDKEGVWRYITQSNVKELNRNKGKFNCIPPSPDNHGPVQVHDTYYLRYADGTPYFQIGTTCYAWAHQGEDMEELTLETLKTSPFNKLRMCLFPISYVYNENEPLTYPYQGEPLTHWDFKRFNPVFWRHFERRVFDLQELGIEADIILFHTYDRWGFESMDMASDHRYLRYVTARLSAFRNVWWSVANEYDLLPDKTMSDWDRYFRIIDLEDPYDHMCSIHNCRDFYDHSKPWVTHVSVQSSDMAMGIRLRQQYKKPVIYDECQYEGNIPQSWGDLSPQEMTSRFWLGALGGCYVGHGETYKHPEDVLWWAKGGLLHGSSPKRIAYFKQILAQAPPFESLRPLGDDQGRYILGDPGKFYLIYFKQPETIQIILAGTRDYKIDMIDPWGMAASPIGTAKAGEANLTSVFPERIFRLTPYEEGEPYFPEVSVQSDVRYGCVPLTAHFKANGNADSYKWIINDAMSKNSETSFTFKEIGQYVISLTGTNKNGVYAMSFLTIDVIPDAPESFDTDKHWPGNRDGLLFYWKAGQKVGDLEITKKSTPLVLNGRVMFTSDGALRFNGGRVASNPVSEQLYECKRTNQLSIEAVIETVDLSQSGPTRIVTFSKDTNSRNFTLGQEKDNLILRLRTPATGENAINPQVTLCRLLKNTKTHIIISYFDGILFFYRNGKLEKRINDIQGDFSTWQTKAQFILGDELTGDRAWRGILYNAALYSRFITEKEAQFKYQILTRDRRVGKFF